MSLSDFYQHKAEQCDHLAAAATDTVTRTRYKEERILWRDLLKDIAKQERSESGPH